MPSEDTALALARSLMSATLHGAPPLRTTMEIAAALVAAAQREEALTAELDDCHAREAVEDQKAARWGRLKFWLEVVTTNGELAEAEVSAMRDIVFLIEEQDRPAEPEEDPPLTGRALLDKAREKRLATLARRDG